MIMQKVKHKKLRNTGLIFDLLSKSVVHEAMNGQPQNSIKIVKRYFTEGSELQKELNLYLSLQNKTNNDAKELMELCLARFKKLDKVKLEREKYELVKSIKKHYLLNEFFKPRTNQYKLTASIFKFFENAETVESPDDYLTAKNYIVEHLDGKVKETITEEQQIWLEQDPDIRRIGFKVMVNKFNEKYRDFSDRQKKLLAKYIAEDCNTDSFRTYLNKELVYITTALQEKIKKVQDEVTKIKLNETLTLIPTIASAKTVKDEHLAGILKFYELIEEL